MAPRASREQNSARTHYIGVTELEHSHEELRGALIVAGREIRKLNFGRKKNRVLLQLRTVLRAARAIAKVERARPKIRLTS